MRRGAIRLWMCAAVLGLTVSLSREANAGLSVSVNGAGVQATQISGATTETFNSFATGTYQSLTTTVGTLTSSNLDIVAANVYGGAGGTGNYIAIGAEGGATSATLTLNGAQNYFGFWWSAMDSKNSVEFFSQGTLLATYTMSSLSPLSSSYLGNPNGSGDGGEDFAYANFAGTAGTTFDKVVFLNADTSTGFEADNFSVANTNNPGASSNVSVVPEPASAILSGLGLAIGLGVFRSRRRPANPA